MLKKFRRRFVIINMALVGSVLLIVLVAFGINLYNNHLSELENTMKQVVDPFDIQMNGLDDFIKKENTPPQIDGAGGWGDNTDADGQGNTPPELPERPEIDPGRDMTKDERRRNDSIATVFYNVKEDSISVISSVDQFDEEILKNAAKEAAKLSDEYGKLDGYGLIYYKEGFGERFKMAFADLSYISSRMKTSVIQLAVVYFVSLAFLLVISILLSKLASKPMEEAINMEREFVANISHDLKTPITIILANNSIIKQNTSTPVSEQIQWIRSTDDAAKSMMGMVDEMLTLSSLESAEKNVAITPVDLSSAAEKSVLQTESLAYDRRITVDESIDENITAMATKEYAERICNSLIENAIKYEPDGGKIGVSLRNEKKRAVLTVKNYGSFISPDDIPHIFERFYRGDKARTGRGGHGLGLPIIKEMVDSVGAEIDVISDAESGTVFTVSFDAAP